MLYYYSLLLVCAGATFLSSKVDKTIGRILTVVFVALPMCALNALRDYDVGADTRMYTMNWALPQIEDSSFSQIWHEGRWEIGFAALCKLCLRTANPARCLLVVTSIIIFTLLTIAAFNISASPALVFFLYTLSGEFYVSMNAMRQAIAMSVVALALVFFYRNKNYVFIFLIICAAMFHKSALVLLLLLVIRWLLGLKSKQIIFAAVIALCIILLVIPAGIIAAVVAILGYDNYLDSVVDGSGHATPIIYLLCFLCWGICWLIADRRDNSQAAICCKSVLVFSILLCVCSVKNAIIFRLIDYGMIGMVLFGGYFRSSHITRNSDVVENALFYGPFIILFCCTTYLIPTWTNVFPYVLGTDF